MKREIVLLKRAGLLPAGQGNAAVIFGVKLFGSSTTAEGVINALPCPAPSRAGVPGTAASPSEPGLRPGALEGGQGRGAHGQQAAPLPPQPAGSQGACPALLSSWSMGA